MGQEQLAHSRFGSGAALIAAGLGPGAALITAGLGLGAALITAGLGLGAALIAAVFWPGALIAAGLEPGAALITVASQPYLAPVCCSVASQPAFAYLEEVWGPELTPGLPRKSRDIWLTTK